MAIIKASNHIEAYRAKARASDINELSGRTGRPDLTQFVTDQIISRLPFFQNSTLVDIGCGDGLLLMRIAERGLNNSGGCLMGILPTEEEVTRVREHLREKNIQKDTISITAGLSTATGLMNEFADLVVCNGVLLILEDIEKVRASLDEIYRIAKPGATIFIGEIPAANEMAAKNYGDSITSWLFWVLKNQGFVAFWLRFKQTLLALLSKEPFIIAPKKLFYMEPGAFIDLLQQHGFTQVDHYQHKEIDLDGNVGLSKTRWDYVIVKN